MFLNVYLNHHDHGNMIVREKTYFRIVSWQYVTKILLHKTCTFVSHMYLSGCVLVVNRYQSSGSSFIILIHMLKKNTSNRNPNKDFSPGKHGKHTITEIINMINMINIGILHLYKTANMMDACINTSIQFTWVGQCRSTHCDANVTYMYITTDNHGNSFLQTVVSEFCSSCVATGSSCLSHYMSTEFSPLSAKCL